MDGQTIRALEFDGDFRRDVLAHEAARDISACFDCKTCTVGCPLHTVNPEHDPRKIARMVNLGMRERVLSSPLIWYCSNCGLCEKHCPQKVRFFSALDVLKEMAVKAGYPAPVSISEDICCGCGICIGLCPYTAIELRTHDVKKVAHLNPTSCRGCGVCNAACPSGAISMNHFQDEQVFAQLVALGSSP